MPEPVQRLGPLAAVVEPRHYKPGTFFTAADVRAKAKRSRQERGSPAATEAE